MWVRTTLLLLIIGVLGACQHDLANDLAQSDSNRVTLALNWFPEVEHGGFYAAEVHGVFERAGVVVEILPGGPGVPVIQQVASGRVAFAVANADQVLLGREKGAPVVAVMAAMQNSPRCIMVHKASGIESLTQLKNVTLAVGSGKPFAKYLLSKLGEAQLTIVPYQGNVAAFLQRQNFAQQAYVFSEPHVAQLQGADPQCLMLSEIGFNPYTSVLITSEKMIADNPQLVSRVVQATVKGWLKYLEAPEKTNRKIHELNSEMSLDSLAFGAHAIRPLCLLKGMEPEMFGTMTVERWKELAEQLQSIGLLDDVNVWKQAFDLQFLAAELN